MIISSRLESKEDVVTNLELKMFFAANFGINNWDSLQNLDGTKIFHPDYSPELYEFELKVKVEEMDAKPIMPGMPMPKMTEFKVIYNGQEYAELPVPLFNYMVYLISQHEHVQILSLEDLRKWDYKDQHD